MKVRWSLCTSVGIGVVVSALAFTSSATAAPLASTHPPVASVDGTTRAAPAGAPQPRAALPSSQRALLLGATWRNSTDTLWNLVPGIDGLSVVRAPVSAGAPWSTVASLSVATVQSRRWIGQGCVLQGSHVAAVAFGPVEYISTAAQFERGAFAAIVDLITGKVSYVKGVRPSFSYFTPKCGGDGTAEFTSFGTEESSTSVTSVTSAGKPTELLHAAAGEVTDLTTVDNRLVGARGANLVAYRLGNKRAKPKVLVHAAGQVFGVQAVRGGAIAYAVNAAGITSVHVLSGGHNVTAAHGPVGKVAVDSLGSTGVSVHGAGAVTDAVTPGVHISQAPRDSIPSIAGGAFTTTQLGAAGGTELQISSVRGTTKSVRLPANSLRPASPSAQMATSATVAATSTATTDANLPCAIKRNDVTTESYQPSVKQVEWAVDEAVTGNLTATNAANYRHYGLPAYSPQGLFPRTGLSGGGTIPPQVMLGVLANESNLDQASSHVTSGGYGNPLTGNIYGRSSDALTIDFNAADCGYGIAQITDGMRTGQMSATNQRTIALDYQANIAQGINILAGKWNQLKGLGINMNDGTPSSIENWYAALWAYNSGLQPNSDNGNTTGCSPGASCTDSAGHWGLGWANNPANPIYPVGRHMFNSVGTDAAHPSDWPYQERVIGWAAYPIYEPNGSYSQAYWTSDQYRVTAIPSPALFCDATNSCSGATASQAGICSQSDLHCWIHHSISWKGACASSGTCGYGQAAYAAAAAEPGDPASTDPADCTRGTLPSNAVVVDDAV